MREMRCDRCGSYAINPHLHGRDNSNPDLCDVCHYRKRSEDSNKRIAELEEAVNILAVYACRYAHTRQTGAANQIVRTILFAGCLTEANKVKIARESHEATFNQSSWQRLREALGGEDE